MSWSFVSGREFLSITGFFWLGFSNVCQAQEVTARDATRMVTAFMCSIYAEKSGDRTEQERLFTLGYETGKFFLNGALAGNISEAEEKKIPLAVLWSLGGPTLEFQLGRIYADAAHRAHGKLNKINDELPGGEDIEKLNAANLFEQRNCALL
jgi:hypothetical protein